jgi:hypothetical protein
MPAGSLADFPRSVDAVRNKQLTRFDPAEARRFEIAFHAEGEGATQLLSGRLADGVWTTEPETLKEGAAETLVRELSGLEGVKVLAESLGEPESAAFGLAPPRAVLRVFGGPEPTSDELLGEVHLGTLDEKRGIAARRPDRATAFWLPAERAQQIPISADALRERFLAPAPEPAAAPDPAPAPAPAEPGSP